MTFSLSTILFKFIETFLFEMKPIRFALITFVSLNTNASLGLKINYVFKSDNFKFFINYY